MITKSHYFHVFLRREIKREIIFVNLLVTSNSSTCRFRCLNNQCIEQHKVCDRKIDCEDGYDESACRKYFIFNIIYNKITNHWDESLDYNF